ncbi:hypothetical protein N9H53_06035 [Flavobacteriaceae bacterium]|jgi:uncharacterized membrane protein (DUF441 family)|nr:hypothetical protein [Flavobacteriaceae bacterium]MDA7808484.1 hypothetical protein [Flavobacteriaceae bacterium]MDA9038272.1 hypothetical protein [Flavobacteriaceae bacterium]MDA9852105.1 hypothetical protein [Flavobacteriaceae bacterium]MDC0385975.1 hypothetical protein [Flavobacteriaceae bacterium]
MKSKFIYPIISIIQILMGVGLLLGVFLDPVGLMQPFFKGEITADLIFFSQGVIDVTATHMIGVGLFVFTLWRLAFDNESNKKIFLAYSVFGGSVLLVALFNHLFRGGGPPIPILILIVSATVLGLYGSKKAID